MVTSKFHEFVIQVQFLTLKIFYKYILKALDGYLDIYDVDVIY